MIKTIGSLEEIAMQQKSGFDYRMIACGCTLVALVPVSGWAASPDGTPEPPPPSYYDEQTATPRASGYPGYPQSHYDYPPRGWQAAPGYGQPSYGRPYYPQGGYPPAYGNPGAVQSAGEMHRQPYYTAPVGTDIKATEAAGQAPASAAIDAPALVEQDVVAPTMAAPEVAAPGVKSPEVVIPAVAAPEVVAPAAEAAPAVVEQAVETPAATQAVIPADVDDPMETMPAPAAGEAKPQGMLEKAKEKVKGLLKSDDATAPAPAAAVPAVEAPAMAAPTVAAPEVVAPDEVAAPAVITPAAEAPTVAVPEVTAPAVVAPTMAAPAVVEQAVETPAATQAVIPADVDDPMETMPAPAAGEAKPQGMLEKAKEKVKSMLNADEPAIPEAE
jgi:hypothetical protein